jgi:hypothetical protein
MHVVHMSPKSSPLKQAEPLPQTLSLMGKQRLGITYKQFSATKWIQWF